MSADDDDEEGGGGEEEPSPGGPTNLDDVIELMAANDARRRARVERFLELQNAGRAMYSDRRGSPVLRESFAVFIDELGTSQRMANYSNANLVDDLALYDQARLSLSNPDDRSDEYARSLYFTDNVLLAVPAWPKAADKGLGYTLGVAAEYQARLATMGRFSRGAITYGKLYADHSFGTGPALVAAVNLEKEARSPRVLLDTRCRELGLNEARALGFGSLEPLDSERLVLRDGGEAFLNYLAAVIDPEQWYTSEALEAHAAVIRDNLHRLAEDEEVRRKYEWLADYHDYFVTQITWFPEYVIGASPQSHAFAPLTNRLFDLGYLVGESLATAFHQVSAREDVNAVVRAGRPALTGLHADEYPDPEGFFAMSREAGMAIHSLWMLRERLSDGSIPQQYVGDLSKLARYCDPVLGTVATVSLQLSGSARCEARARLRALADGLRLTRLSPQHGNVGRLKALELGRLVGAKETDQDVDP